MNLNSMGVREYIKEGLELTPMGPFDIEQGGVNSGPDSRGVLSECEQTDLPSACVLHPLNRPVLDFETGRLVG